MSLAKSTVAMMLPVTDTDRAKTFYSEKLGLDYTGTNEEGSPMYALGGGATLVLLPRPDSTPVGEHGDELRGRRRRPARCASSSSAASSSRTTTCRT